jgi:hypothetical protein
MLTLSCAYVLWSVPAVSFAQSQARTPSPQPALSPDQEEDEEIEELEEEVGDRDPTYLRTRTVVRYDRRLLGPASLDRFRLRLLYGFGPKQRYAVSALEPIVRVDTGHVPLADPATRRCNSTRTSCMGNAFGLEWPCRRRFRPRATP